MRQHERASAKTVPNANDIAELERRGAVGEICGHFFNATGRECQSRWKDRVIAVELDYRKKIPQVIGVAAGAERAPARDRPVLCRICDIKLVDPAGALFPAFLLFSAANVGSRTLSLRESPMNIAPGDLVREANTISDSACITP